MRSARISPVPWASASTRCWSRAAFMRKSLAFTKAISCPITCRIGSVARHSRRPRSRICSPGRRETPLLTHLLTSWPVEVETRFMSSDEPLPSIPSSFAVCRDREPIPERLKGAVAAIGNFDGVHRGHRYLLDMALRSGRPATVLTFEPHPRSFFHPDKPLFRLTPEPVKLEIFVRLGLAGAFVRRFDHALAALDAEGFVELLAQELELSGVVIGHDFHFGRGREGNPERMSELCRKLGLDCSIAHAIVEGSEPVSSSAIRAALE